MNQQWQILPQAPDEYLAACGTSPIIAQLLYNRDVRSDEIEAFLAADHRLQGNPSSLPDISQAVNRIYKALLSKEKIAVFGDFDADGITATALLAEGLSWLGTSATPYIPGRLSEGHGLNSPAIETLHSEGISLIITVDCGITNITEAKRAREIGVDMIITDHHVPSATLPQAVAVINPKRKDSRYPFSGFSGAGVAFKLLQAVFHGDNRQQSLERLLDLVALATVTDMVPITGENRYLVKEGLKALNTTHRIGLQEMIKLAGLKSGELDTEHISWTLGPRLNAAGRMDDVSISYRLLTTQSPAEAHSLAAQLEEKNAERQKLTNEMLNKAKERLANKTQLPLLIDGHDSYPMGVIGLVAGKLADEFHRPAIIINLGPELCRGACRSVPEFDIVSALEECHDLLTAFGGHPAAAGFAVARHDLVQLEERLMRLATSKLSQLDLRPKLVIDAEVPLSAFSGETFGSIQKLAPFGHDNPYPTFLSRQVEVVECRNFGNQGKWLRLTLKQGNITWKAVDFESQKAREEIPSRIDIVYTVEKSRWNGEEVLRLNLRDFAPS
jgi:single-stranded-DNA-specific exonuclease